MQIDIIDLDTFYAAALAKRLRAAVPGAKVSWRRSPEEPLHSPEDEEDGEQIVLHIYTGEQFPDFEPPEHHLKLMDESPFLEESSSQVLRRLGPVSEITAAVVRFFQEHEHRTPRNPVSSLMTWTWSEELRQMIRQRILAASRSGLQTLVAELGPAVLFPASVTANNLDFLVDLSLRKIDAGNCGRYFEPWPPLPEALRLKLPSRSDDWVLSPETLIIDAVNLITDWAQMQFHANWRLYVITAYLPFRLCHPLAALSEEVELIPAPWEINEGLWRTEQEELAGLLPGGGRFQITDTERNTHG